MADEALTPRQRRFVEEYAIDLNGAQAAIRAGYSLDAAKEQASRLLTNVNVKEAVEKALRAKSFRLKINADWVLKRLVRNAVRAAAAVPVRDREGKPTGEYQYEGNVVNKALELVGKSVGMFTDNLKLSGKVSYEDVTDDDLDKRIAAEQAAIARNAEREAEEDGGDGGADAPTVVPGDD